MNEINEKFLPLGTIVLLNGGEKRLMITGYCVMDAEGASDIYDYVGVLFPEGTYSSEENILFNHDQIVKVFFTGFVDDEQITFMDELKKELEKDNNETTNTNTVFAQSNAEDNTQTVFSQEQ